MLLTRLNFRQHVISEKLHITNNIRGLKKSVVSRQIVSEYVEGFGECLRDIISCRSALLPLVSKMLDLTAAL